MPASPLSPPGTTEMLHAQRVLVLAPHYDDETYGCGGLLAQLATSGASVQVLFLTDSGGGEEAVVDRASYSQTRKAEAQAAMAVLGLGAAEHVDLPDGGLDQHPEALLGALKTAVERERPELMLVPSPLETSSDHRAAFRAVHTLLGPIRAGDPLAPWAEQLVVLAYEVNHPLYPNVLVDVGAHQTAVEQAAACYASQEARHGYGAARRGLTRFRTLSLPADVEAAEGFVRLRLDDFVTRGHASLVQRLGGVPTLLPVTAGPQISVVVRTRDRPALLAEALASLAMSTYRRAEVVLVNDGGATPTVPADFPLPVVRVDHAESQGRAAAANAGIAAATGDAIAFLDDDDLAEPEHLAILAGLISGAGVRVAYTDAAVGVYEPDAHQGWACRERRLPYSRDFDPTLLALDNYIPLNTLIIARDVFDVVGLFDPSLPFFEDWDWLIRCAGHVTFHHLARVTCEYRQFRGAGHHVLGDRPRERADFLGMKARVLDKHRDRITAEALAGAVDGLRAEAVAAREDSTASNQREAASRARHHEINGDLESARTELAVERITVQRLSTEIDGLRGELAGRDEELHRRGHRIERLGDDAARAAEARDLAEAEVERLRAHHADLDRQLAATYAEIERLGEIQRTMESTRAWRLHQWLQRRRS